jgi:hypothetical protein
LSLTLLPAIGLSLEARAADSGFINRLRQYYQSGDDIIDRWDDARGDLDSEHGKSESARYYSDLLKFYVKDPLAAAIPGVEGAFADYGEAVSRAYSESGIRNPERIESCNDASISKKRASELGSTVADQMRQLAAGGSIRTSGGSSMGKNFDSKELTAAVNDALVDLNKVYNCCEDLRKDRNREVVDKTDVNAAVFGTEACSKLKNSLDDAQKRLKNSLTASVPPAPSVPDPSSVFDGDDRLFGYFLQEHNYLASELRRARNRHRDDLEAAAEAEDEILQNVKSACEKGTEKAQEKANPVSKTLVTSLGKAIKCHVLPAVATTQWDLQWQRLAVAGSMIPIEGKDWDVNCDPNESAQYLAMRTDDPNQLSRQWGLDTMSNPDYIARLRALQPTSSFPIVANPGPGGGYFTGLGVYGVNQNALPSSTTPLNSSAARGQTSGVSVAGTGTTTSSSTRLASSRTRSAALASTSSSSPSQLSRTASASARTAQARGIGRANQVRSMSNSIRNGDNPVQLATTLKSGASKTRDFALSVADNNAKLSSSQRRTLDTQSASTARSSVISLAGVRGSRATAQDVMEAIEQGRGNPGSTIGSLDQRRADAERARQEELAKQEAERRRLDDLMTQVIGRIEEAQGKQRAKLSEIQALINERDIMIAGVLQEIMEKPPKAQSERVQQLRLELMQKDKEISLLKIEYDGYDASILQQNVIAQSLQYNGANSPYFTPGAGSGGTRGQTDRGAFMPILDLLVPKAFAAPSGPAVDFIGGVDRLVADLRKRIAGYDAEEKRILKSMYQAYKARGDAITPATVRDFDSGVMLEAGIYADALYLEAKDLVDAAADRRAPSPMPANVVSLLVQTRDDADQARKALDRIALQFKDSYPLKPDDNAEVWWSMVPGAILQ